MAAASQRRRLRVGPGTTAASAGEEGFTRGMFYDFLRLHHQDSNAFSFVVVVVPRIVTNIRDTKIFRAIPTTPLTACVCLPGCVCV